MGESFPALGLIIGVVDAEMTGADHDPRHLFAPDFITKRHPARGRAEHAVHIFSKMGVNLPMGRVALTPTKRRYQAQKRRITRHPL
jgi:hypothetical protein